MNQLIFLHSIFTNEEEGDKDLQDHLWSTEELYILTINKFWTPFDVFFFTFKMENSLKYDPSLYRFIYSKIASKTVIKGLGLKEQKMNSEYCKHQFLL